MILSSFLYPTMKRFRLNLNTAVQSLTLAIVTFSFIVTGGRLSIRECHPQGQMNISDDSDTHSTFTCDGFLATETAQWIFRVNTNVTISKTCGPPGQPCDPKDSDFYVARLNTSFSILTIEHTFWKRQKYGSVVCSILKDGSIFETCNVSVFTPTESTTVQTDSSRTPGPTTEGQENEDDSNRLPVEAVGGGVAALVVILLLLIIIVVVVVKRRKRQKAAGNNNDDLEEHVNPMHGSRDEPDTASPSYSKPSGVALRNPTDISNSNNAATLEDADNSFDAGYSSMAFGEQQTVSPSSTPSPDGQSTQNTANQAGFPTNTTTQVVVTDADLYTAVGDMDQEQTSGPVQDHAGGHSTEGGPTSSSTAAPSGDVYAVVQKSGPMAQNVSATTTVSPNYPGDSADGAYAFVDVSRSSAPTSSASKAPSVDPVSDNADNTYAVVNKSSSRGKGTGPSPSPDTSNGSQQAPSGDVYAQVDKSSKRNGSTRENDGEGQSYVYAQVDKGNNPSPVRQTQAQDQKPGIKPKPAFKPKPSSNV